MDAGSGLPDAVPALETSERWRLTEELFYRALDCPAAERAAQVAAWCGTDSALRESVLALLSADSSVEELISSAAPLDPTDFLEREDEAVGAGREVDLDPWAGRTLGAFRIERLLGRGGMGVVYLGQRISGGFHQTVAVKLVGRHLRSSPAVAQFLLERETLARLEHANIARLLDGGVTDEGFPYVVMEYVEGRRLDAACDDPATTIHQIIRWMLQLCEAVTYVHRNLILHRDLKPGNVMVTDEGQVKLLDFGTLKRIGPEGDTDSEMTQAGMRPVTVRYASPEHIQGTLASTATDTYSLGMILYRLLAGRLPENLDNLPIGLYLERLKESRFKPPSQVAAEVNSARRIDPQIARDLDAIVAKATRYEPEARYATAGALAEDLWSVLLDRPVSARAGIVRYQTAKFYRRYRWPLRAATAALCVLTVGLGIMAWQGHIARQQEQLALQGMEVERKLAHMLLFDYFEQLALIPGSIEAQKKAVTQALAYLDNLTRIAPGSSLELDTIRGFTDMGSLLGDTYSQNLGDVPGAIQSLNKAIALAQARVQKNPNDLPSQHLLLKAYIALGSVYLGNGDALRAEQAYLPGTQIAADLARNTRSTAPMLESASSIVDLIGDVYDPGRGYVTASMDKAMEYYKLSDTYDELCNRADPKLAMCNAGIVVSEYKFGSLVEDPDPALAAAHYRHGLDVVLQYPPELMKTTRSHRFKYYMMCRLGLMELRLGRTSESREHVRESLEGFRELIAKAELDNRARFDLVAFETDLAVDYDRYGREQEASAASKEVLGLLDTLLHRSPNNIRWQMIQGQNWLTYGRAETKLGHNSTGAEASRHGLQELVHLAQSKDASPQALGFAADALLELHSSPQDAQLALTFAQRAVDAYARPTPTQLLTLAKAEAAVGHAREAAKTAKTALASLNGPVKSKIVADQIADAHKLIQNEIAANAAN